MTPTILTSPHFIISAPLNSLSENTRSPNPATLGRDTESKLPGDQGLQGSGAQVTGPPYPFQKHKSGLGRAGHTKPQAPVPRTLPPEPLSSLCGIEEWWETASSKAG